MSVRGLSKIQSPRIAKSDAQRAIVARKLLPGVCCTWQGARLKILAVSQETRPFHKKNPVEYFPLPCKSQIAGDDIC
jgi:hypothetical protein